MLFHDGRTARHPRTLRSLALARCAGASILANGAKDTNDVNRETGIVVARGFTGADALHPIMVFHGMNPGKNPVSRMRRCAREPGATESFLLLAPVYQASASPPGGVRVSRSR